MFFSKCTGSGRLERIPGRLLCPHHQMVSILSKSDELSNGTMEK